MQDAIRPVYEDLSSSDLLRKCVGGFTQNSNEGLNALIWKVAPKETHSGSIIVQITTYIATGMFNEGHMSLLKTLKTLSIKIANAAHYMCQEADAQRISTGELKAQQATTEGRIHRRQSRLQAEVAQIAEEGHLYDAGTAD